MYGKPFDQGNTNRLAFWPSQITAMPLLYFVASTLLTAPGASTENVRSHSVSGRVVSKARCRLLGASVDRNTTGYIWLRKRAAAKAAEFSAEGYHPEDLDDNPEIGALFEEDEVIELDGDPGGEGEEE